MSLIFSLLKTHFLMFVFCTLSLSLKHFDFHFSFDILALLMKFLAFLCEECVTGHLAMETMTASQKVDWRFFREFFHK